MNIEVRIQQKFSALGFATLLALYSCGNTYSNSGGAISPVSTGIVLEVECATVVAAGIVNISTTFSPASETIIMNGIVKWINNDPSTQTVTSGIPGAPDVRFDVSLSPSSSKCLKFTGSGTFNYFNKNLPTMTGQVIVQ